ncbi:hypothetical protein R50073_13880 [Maricurvus nonylphenolicus]|uniref:DUF4202 domain-containing protein n=1 Tax=Maricurvus nonylphenolicus TaxID=1008307 RepID=UPI0036F35FA7
MSNLEKLLDAIDQVNSQDPNQETYKDQSFPKELLYSQRMSQHLNAFAPEASEELQIAARAQHIKRWSIPRSDYPMDRPGYKKWRTELGKFHADTTTSLMADAGYSEEQQERVATLLQKKFLKRDEEVQCLEDVICLVFLEFYLEAFVAKHSSDEDKLIGIIQKTWRKMSEKGHEAALKLPLSDAMGALVGKALNG